MKPHSIFLSCIVVSRNNEAVLRKELSDITVSLRKLVSDYELVVVDNASNDNSVGLLKALTLPEGLPNLQVYALTNEVDKDCATCVGIENALGDFVAIYNCDVDDFSVLEEMLDKAVSGNDVVFASNKRKQLQTLGYRMANGLFNFIYKKFNGINLTKDAPGFRVLSRSVVNFILQHSQPTISYRHLPASAGFAKTYIEYDTELKQLHFKKLSRSIETGIRLMVSTTRAPMRIVTFLSIFGASANLIYSIYVVIVALVVDSVEPGWVSTSLQISGMFFLISLVLFVLGEYILHMASLSNEGPRYHIGQEFTSARVTRFERLNLEENETPNN